MKVYISTTNLNDTACMFNTYFELAYNNNTGESLVVVAKIVFNVAVMTSRSVFCSRDHFKVPVITSSVVFVETEITF